jgi:predicted CXXCH cytochrome family protein
MSCHDGITSIAVGTLINAPYSELGRSQVILDPAGTSYSAIGELYRGPTNLTLPTWGPNIGNMITGDTNADLSDDHPVSFTWVPGITGIKEPAAWGAAPLKLFNNRMECSTCHDVHDNTNPPFLRMSNTNSNMCLSCHIK